MQPLIYPVAALGDGHLSVMAHPSGGKKLESELLGLRAQGVDRVVSLLEPGEEADMELVDEGSLCRELGLCFTSFPITDYGIPAYRDDALDLVEALYKEISNGSRVVVHCRAGIGRSGLIACALLVRDGLTPGAAIHEASFARGEPVPQTDEQVAWVRSLGGER